MKGGTCMLSYVYVFSLCFFPDHKEASSTTYAQNGTLMYLSEALLVGKQILLEF